MCFSVNHSHEAHLVRGRTASEGGGLTEQTLHAFTHFSLSENDLNTVLVDFHCEWPPPDDTVNNADDGSDLKASADDDVVTVIACTQHR
jgi:hypothetical protein